MSTLGSETEVFGPRLDATLQWAIRLVTVLLTGLLLTAGVPARRRPPTPPRARRAGRVHGRRALAGTPVLGTQYTTQVLAETGGMNFVFALVLGLIGIIYFAALMGVIGIEVNVVLARRLWPRALRTLFADRGELTEADRRAYASYVRAQQHKRPRSSRSASRTPTPASCTSSRSRGRGAG